LVDGCVDLGLKDPIREVEIDFSERVRRLHIAEALSYRRISLGE